MSDQVEHKGLPAPVTELGKQLRTMIAAVVGEPLPPDMVALIEEIERKLGQAAPQKKI